MTVGAIISIVIVATALLMTMVVIALVIDDVESEEKE